MPVILNGKNLVGGELNGKKLKAVYNGDKLIWQDALPIEFISATAVSSSSAPFTIPTHNVADLIIMAAGRNNATWPDLDSGWTNVLTVGAGAFSGSSMRVGYKIAASGSESSGVWTNAQRYMPVVYRGADGIGAFATDSGENTAPTAPGISLQQPGSSWVLRLLHMNGGSGAAAPLGHVQRVAWAYDTDGPVASAPAVALASSAVYWTTATIELLVA